MPGFLRPRLQWATIIGCVAVWLTSAASFGADAKSAASDEVERFPIKRGEAISIPVEVFGEKLTFILDTGATISAIDISYRQHLTSLTKQKKIETADTVREFEVFRGPEMKIGVSAPQQFQPRFIVGLDLTIARTATGFNEMGVVGMDFISTQVVRFSFDEGFVALQRKPTPGATHDEKMTIVRGTPHIPMQISDLGTQSVMIDTGSTNGVALESKLFKQLLSRKRIVVTGTTEHVVAGGVAKLRYGIVDSIKLGPYRFRNVKVDESQGNRIGLDFLERFDIELDFSNHQVHFRPGERINEPERRNCAGITVERVDGQTKIHEVISDSIAEKSGARKGDVIVEMNGTPADQFTLPTIRGSCYESGTELKLSLVRDGQIRNITLALERPDDPFPSKEPSPTVKQVSHEKPQKSAIVRWWNNIGWSRGKK